MKSVLKFFIILAFSASLSSCGRDDYFNQLRGDGLRDLPRRADSWFEKQVGVNKFDKIDPYGDLGREDYMELASIDRRDKNISKIKSPEISLPKFDDLMEEEGPNSLIDDKLVSISVNEDVPLKEVLVELARRAEVDVEIDKNISGSIIFIAKDKPFSEVIGRIANIADLVYSIDNGVLKITRDNPVIKSYKFSFLDLSRDSTSTVNSSFSVGGGGGGDGQATVNSGSTSQLDIKSGDGDIWKEVQTGVQEILLKYVVPGLSNSSSGGNAQQANSLGGVVPIGQSSIISMNKKAGLLSVLANSKQHQAIKEYLDTVHISLTSQVILEAKILEVSLDDEYSSGINWNLVPKPGQLSNSIYLGSALGATSAVTAGDGIGTLARAASDKLKLSVLPTELFGGSYSLDASVEFLQKFGVTRSLANPRISTMNNQFAILNFAKNFVYFDVQLQQQQQQATGVSPVVNNFSVTSEIKTVPVGVILNIQPSIDLERNEISFSVRPTLTRVTESVDNPGVTISAEQLGVDSSTLNSQVPVVEVREIDTVFKVKNGQIMVIGGLLEERSGNTDTGLPGFSSLPYIGNMFKNTEKSINTVETVIFMKATIVPGQGVSVEDKKYYKNFSSSNRKFFTE